MELYSGIDLHSRNNFIGVINGKDERVYSKRHANRLPEVLSVLRPFKRSLKGVVVESTYNWYWLVDGLQENGYKVHLANPAAIQQYEGLKHTDDQWDAFWLAHLLRLGILPEGYIYPKEDRPVRDILRRRGLYVKYRTSQILSLQSAISRNLGYDMPGSAIKLLREEDAESMFEASPLRLSAKIGIDTIEGLTQKIELIEEEVMPQAKLKPEFEPLLTTPGIGKILGMTVMLEVGDIGRFPSVGDYSSYCRCVKSTRITNGKKKGEGNRKNGNKYLGWAYVEAAHHAKRACAKAQSFYQRKKAKTMGAVATKALANKLARATYYVMRDQVPFDEDKLFG